MQDWRSDAVLPIADGRWGFWRPPFGKRRYGESDVKRAIWQWHPLDPVLVSSPASCHFVPPICVPELATQVHARMLLQYRLLLALLAVMTFGALVASLNTGAGIFQRATVAGVLIFAFVGVQYMVFFRQVERLGELARYVSWLYLQRSGLVLGVIIAMCALAALQFLLQQQAGGLEPLLMKFGLVFDAARDQPWRFLSGPFFHSGPVHWIGNLMLAVIAAGLAAPIASKAKLLLIFLVGTVVPCVLLAQFPPQIRLDAFLGLSGGIFAVYGWVAGVSLRRPTLFPRNFTILIAAFAVMTVGVTSLLNFKSNDFVHVAGWLLGLVAGLACFALRPVEAKQ